MLSIWAVRAAHSKRCHRVGLVSRIARMVFLEVASSAFAIASGAVLAWVDVGMVVLKDMPLVAGLYGAPQVVPFLAVSHLM